MESNRVLNLHPVEKYSIRFFHWRMGRENKRTADAKKIFKKEKGHGTLTKSSRRSKCLQSPAALRNGETFPKRPTDTRWCSVMTVKNSGVQKWKREKQMMPLMEFAAEWQRIASNAITVGNVDFSLYTTLIRSRPSRLGGNFDPAQSSCFLH